ncbi:MAG: GTPase HflX, partial [Candidatus Marinimicrobia bacterium]|nr:GTPase HflX [Candidatus Neomarinimicrobiota bacterium]
ERGVTESSVKELKLLAETLEIEVVDTIIQNSARFHNVHYVGKGMLEKIGMLVEELDIKVVICDDELTPSQQKNIQKELGDCRVMDRSSLILDIFNDHAKTKEAKTQVELARMEYMLPRLSHKWTHLERQKGGIDMRGGPGETQIEVDRRLIRDQIKQLKMQLKKIALQGDTTSKHRSKYFNVAIVGYTNAGKSTLMNITTSAEVAVENKLFKTLDTTIRKLEIDKSHKIFLSDTVGFIRKLPHQLVASFRSTLKEVKEADLLLKVIDISDPNFLQHKKTIDDELKEFKIPEKNFINVYNKIDMIETSDITMIKKQLDDGIYISAFRDIGVDKLLAEITKKMDSHSRQRIIRIPHINGKANSAIYQFGNILEQKVEDEFTEYKVAIRDSMFEKFVKTYNISDVL